jgi:hypothetical protein
MVLTAPASGPVTPPAAAVTAADLAAYVSSPTVPTGMQQHVTTALTNVASKCGPIVGGQWRFLRRQPPGSHCLSLPRVPTVTLSSLDGLVDPLGVDRLAAVVVSTDVDWLLQTILAPVQVPGLWTVTATIARPAADTEALKLAVLLIAKSLWEGTRGQTARPASFNPEDAAAASARAAEIMRPYLRRRLAAS